MDLKSCPICDSENIVCVTNKVVAVSYIECKGCGTRTGDYMLELEAIETWNMRVREEKIWERIEKFRESLELENQYDPCYRG